MMKRSKVSRSSELQRERSPLRKMHSSRKRALHRSPQQNSRPSHIQRSSSSSMKRGTSSGAKHLRSPPERSPSPSARHARNYSHDSAAPRRRLSHKKSYDLVKRRSPQPPLGHGLSAREMPARSVTPPQSSRYQSARGRESDQDFDSPPKKKLHRVSERYASDHSPPRMPISRPIHQRSQSSSSHRGDPENHQGPMHPGTRDFALSHGSDRPSGSHFHSQGNGRDGYLPSSLEKLKRHDQSRLYMNEKRYGPTLDQRFSSDSNRGMEPRIHYSRSDLEKITIDIRPAVRDSSPTVRRIMNPDEVKLVRRPSEGKKPIFDREEIKQAPRDLREDAHYEHRNISSLVTSSMSHYGMTRRELENYEITRHKFDSFHGTSSSSEMRTLNDRWQKLDSKKVEPSYFDRDERPAQSFAGKPRRSNSYSDDERPNVPRSYDRDYRDDKYSQSSGPPYHRDDYADSHRPVSSNPTDLRHSLSVRRKDDMSDPRDRMMNHRDDEPRSHWHPVPKSMPENSSDKMRGKRNMSRGSRPISPRWDYESESNRGNPRGEKLPSYAERSDRFKYPSWSEKPDGPSRSPSFFEPEDRYSSEVNRFRSPGRPGSGRIFRSRPFRGGLRGGMRGRGMFRGGSSSRGLGYSSRGMK